MVFICDARSQVPRDADGRPFSAADGSEAPPCAALCGMQRRRGISHGRLSRAIRISAAGFTIPKASPGLRLKRFTIRVCATGTWAPLMPGGWHWGGAALACVGIALVAIDASRDLAWIRGYVIGLKCLILGGVFLSRGFIERREFRK